MKIKQYKINGRGNILLCNYLYLFIDKPKATVIYKPIQFHYHFLTMNGANTKWPEFNCVSFSLKMILIYVTSVVPDSVSKVNATLMDKI